MALATHSASELGNLIAILIEGTLDLALGAGPFPERRIRISPN